MPGASLFFRFSDLKSATMALELLNELGYVAALVEQEDPGQPPTLEVGVERADLASALEITQAYGGQLWQAGEPGKQMDAIDAAYDLDEVIIPAHIVNEDLPDDPLRSDTIADSFPERVADLSNDDYNHFEPGVRL